MLRAAAWLIAWGDPQRARVFLTRMDELAPIPAERTLTAAFALSAGMPDSAVFVARRMGRDGLAVAACRLARALRPRRPARPGVLARHHAAGEQFRHRRRQPLRRARPDAIDAAHGAAVAQQLGVPVSLAALTADASSNIRLGTAYLQEVLTPLR